ncbi:MAG: aldehyde dehydrogenase family protein, partial [Deltaproteobacteria bacterium]|nr:aldehyde dehydrogenase family protein [Deltaproteobacteria bacterium]
KRLLLEEIGKIKQNKSVDGDGDNDVGSMTTDFQVATVAAHVRSAQEAGARLLTGTSWDFKSKTIPPLVLENVTDKMAVINEETFGPVLPLVTFKNEHDAITKANNSRFALSASVWTKDPERAYRVTRHLVTGNVSVNNVMLTEANPGLPFGGSKESGFGRYKGEFGLYAFSNIKSVLFDGNSSKIEANWFPYTREKYVLFTDMMVALFSTGFGSLLKFISCGLKLESYSNKATRTPASAQPLPEAQTRSIQPEAK